MFSHIFCCSKCVEILDAIKKTRFQSCVHVKLKLSICNNKFRCFLQGTLSCVNETSLTLRVEFVSGCFSAGRADSSENELPRMSASLSKLSLCDDVIGPASPDVLAPSPSAPQPGQGQSAHLFIEHQACVWNRSFSVRSQVSKNTTTCLKYNPQRYQKAATPPVTHNGNANSFSAKVFVGVCVRCTFFWGHVCRCCHCHHHCHYGRTPAPPLPAKP